MSTAMHYEIHGDGPPVLLVHGAGEDSALLRPQALALARHGFRAISYDRRGTGRSPRDGWPEAGMAGHVEDAAGLLSTLTDRPVRVLGFSSGGVIALALAASRPELVAEAAAWEPPALTVLPDADALHETIMAPVTAYLTDHPGDWSGAYDVMLTSISGGAADLAGPLVTAMRPNAEAAVRDDAAVITRHRFGSDELREAPVVVAVSSTPNPLHAQIADRLAEETGQALWTVDAADDHEVYLKRPEVLAAALGARS